MVIFSDIQNISRCMFVYCIAKNEYIKTSNQNINTGVDGGLVYRNSINMDDQMFRLLLFITLNIFLKW